MEEKYRKLKKSNPEYISKEKLCKICKISKKSAAYYLENNLIPNENNGKATHKYMIKMTDVIAFLMDKEEYPAKYRVGYPPEQKLRIDKSQYDTDQLKAFYTKKLSEYPDMLFISEISEITGYPHKRIVAWIQNEKIFSLKKDNRYIIPKSILINFISSSYYNYLHVMSQKHIGMLIEFKNTVTKIITKKENHDE